MWWLESAMICPESNCLGISLLFHTLPLDSETASVENIIRLIGMESNFNIKLQ